MGKRFFVSVVAVFVFALLWNGVVHAFVLHEANLELTSFARPVEERSLVVALLLTFGIASLFVGAFYRWTREGSLREGLQLGVFFALLAGLLVDLNQYLLYPLSAALAVKWFAFGLVEFSVYGLIVSVLYRWTGE